MKLVILDVELAPCDCLRCRLWAVAEIVAGALVLIGSLVALLFAVLVAGAATGAL